MSSATSRLERPRPHSLLVPAAPDPPFSSPSHPLATALRALSNAFRQKHTTSFPIFLTLLTTHSRLPALLPTYNPLIASPHLTAHLLALPPPPATSPLFTVFTLYYLHHATPPRYRRPFALSPAQFADLYGFYLLCVGGGGVGHHEDAVWCYGELRRVGALWIVPDCVAVAVSGGDDDGSISKRRTTDGKDETIADDDAASASDSDDPPPPPPPPPPPSTLTRLERDYNALKAALGEPLLTTTTTAAAVDDDNNPADMRYSLDDTVVSPLRQADSLRAALRAHLWESEEPIPTACLNAADAATAANATRKRSRRDA
ncbi:hypothetical protein HDU87_006386 [Geranomyces variabilis]|uniref:Uncharacterized protein n=1 Tax=Geranomyces variabilis TaxID=109894 RepID=A0AAD5TFG8_9FUNG|nr:hypothetical protein HDU87_006386 [Geranomyces variabilis]